MSFLEFFQANIILFVAIAALSAYLAISELRGSKGKATSISVSALSQAANRGAKIIDLRSPEDYKLGHIAGATNIPLDDFPNHVEKLAKKDKAIILYCYKGVSATKAVTQLQKAGHTNVSQLKGGMAAWKLENLPTAQA